MKMQGNCIYRAEIFGKLFGEMEKQHVGGHEMVRIIDREKF